MTIRYESNPPKTDCDTDVDWAIARMYDRIARVSDKCDGIHITENVLGYERVSPITIGQRIKRLRPKIPVTVSLRVRDKTAREISDFADKCIASRFSGILVLQGDRLRDGRPDTNQTASEVVARFREAGLDSRIDLYMAITNAPSRLQIHKKIAAGPKGFFTQVVQTVRQVEELAARLNGFKIIPIVLYPSARNRRSAEFLGIDMNVYGDDFEQFVSRIHDITGDILITSPNDFAGIYSFLDGFSSSTKEFTA